MAGSAQINLAVVACPGPCGDRSRRCCGVAPPTSTSAADAIAGRTGTRDAGRSAIREPDRGCRAGVLQRRHDRRDDRTTRQPGSPAPGCDLADLGHALQKQSGAARPDRARTGSAVCSGRKCSARRGQGAHHRPAHPDERPEPHLGAPVRPRAEQHAEAAKRDRAGYCW